MESQLLKQNQPEVCSFSRMQSYNQTTFSFKVFQCKKCSSLQEEKSSPARASVVYAQVQETRKRGQWTTTKRCSSLFLLASPSRPVNIYCRDGQTPAQDAQRGPRVSILLGLRHSWTQHWATQSNQACSELIKEMNKETSGGSSKPKLLFIYNQRTIFNNYFSNCTTSALRLSVLLPEQVAWRI